MKRFLVSMVLSISCIGVFAAAPASSDSVDALVLITECGEMVQIPNKNYTGRQVDQLTTIFTDVLC